MKNLFKAKLPKIGHESFETLFKNKNVKIKKIVSNSLATKQTFKQDKNEFVVLLKGKATLKMGKKIYKLKKGDLLFIKKNKKHSLLNTSKKAIWLAFYF
jgi:cupin 2 domain-containing protein